MDDLSNLAVPAAIMLVFFILSLAIQLLFIYAAIKVLTISKLLQETNSLLRELVEVQKPIDYD